MATNSRQKLFSSREYHISRAPNFTVSNMRHTIFIYLLWCNWVDYKWNCIVLMEYFNMAAFRTDFCINHNVEHLCYNIMSVDRQWHGDTRGEQTYAFAGNRRFASNPSILSTPFNSTRSLMAILIWYYLLEPDDFFRCRRKLKAQHTNFGLHHNHHISNELLTSFSEEVFNKRGKCWINWLKRYGWIEFRSALFNRAIICYM